MPFRKMKRTKQTDDPSYPFAAVEDLQGEGKGGTGHLGGREVHHLVVHHGELHKVLCQGVVLSSHLERF